MQRHREIAFAAATAVDMDVRAGLQAAAVQSRTELIGLLAASKKKEAKPYKSQITSADQKRWDETKHKRDWSGKFTFKTAADQTGKGGGGGGKGGKGGGGKGAADKADRAAKALAKAAEAERKKAARAQVDTEREADREQRAREDDELAEQADRRAMDAEARRLQRRAEDEQIRLAAKAISEAKNSKNVDPAGAVRVLERMLARAREADEQAEIEVLEKDLAAAREAKVKYDKWKEDVAQADVDLEDLRAKVHVRRFEEDEKSRVETFMRGQESRERSRLRRARQEALRARWKAMTSALVAHGMESVDPGFAVAMDDGLEMVAECDTVGLRRVLELPVDGGVLIIYAELVPVCDKDAGDINPDDPYDLQPPPQDQTPPVVDHDQFNADFDKAFRIVGSFIADQFSTVLASAGLVASGDSFDGACIVLLPEGDETVTYPDGAEAPLHMTLAYLGPYDELTPGDIVALEHFVEFLATTMDPFTIGKLSDAQFGDTPVVIYQDEHISDLRDDVENDAEVGHIIDRGETHPGFLPHISSGPDKAKITKIGLWIGENRQEWPLQTQDHRLQTSESVTTGESK
jgi:hypothetical protein